MHVKGKTIGMLLIAMMLVSLVLSGCSKGSNEEESSGNTGSKSDKVNIKIMAWTPAQNEIDVNNKAIQDYMDANPNVNITLEFLPTGYNERLLAQYASGDAPDIFFVANPDIPSYVEKDMIVPIGDRMEKDGITADQLYEASLGMYKDNIYNWAPIIQPQIMYYNKTMFDDAGVAYPTDDWTWGDLAASAGKLTKKDGNKITQYGFQADEYVRVFLSHLWSNGGETFDDPTQPTKALFDSEQGENAVQFLKDMVSTFNVSPPPGLQGGLGYREAFANQKSAIILDGAWNFSTFSAKPDLAYNVALVPAGDTHSVWSNACGWVISSQSKNKDIAWDIIKTALSGQSTSLELADYGGSDFSGFPAWKAATGDANWKPSEMIATVQRQMEYARSFDAFLDQGKWSWDIMNSGLQEIVMTDKDNKAGLSDLVKITQSDIIDKLPK
ncbi:ABC transporter substrate-binding protein [Cohnella boryungensis]|uniref:ABC transporter substrate-binding protein n=1 Tax=Cohnella boryungensis TaxID=768479 RepID=A0ABV8SIF9_9BACL